MLCEVGASVGSSQVSSGIHINAKAQGFPAEVVMLMISVYLRVGWSLFSNTFGPSLWTNILVSSCLCPYDAWFLKTITLTI